MPISSFSLRLVVTARPWKPAVELDGALQCGHLPYAITLAAEVAGAGARRVFDRRVWV